MNQENQESASLNKTEIINSLKETLEATTTKIKEINPSWNEFRTDYPHCPPIDNYDLKFIADNTLKKLTQLADIRLDEYHLKVLSSYTKQVQKIDTNRLFHTPNPPDCFYKIVAYTTLMQSINAFLDQLLSWENIKGTTLIPKGLRQRLSHIDNKLKEIEPSTEVLDKKVKAINDAYESAESLPTTLDELQEANETIKKLQEESIQDRRKIADWLYGYAQEKEERESLRQEIKKLKEEAKQVLDRANDAGLAGAFNKEAKSLHKSVWTYSLFLLAILCGAGYLSYLRYDSLIQLIQSGADRNTLLMLFGISIVGLGAFVWGAWVCTGQIKQRFRLAQDYAFKATLARSYNAYREQANALGDPLLQERLFAIAVSRLDEQPLRVIDKDISNSPLEAILSRPDLQEKMRLFPDLREYLTKVIHIITGKKKSPPEIKHVNPSENSESDNKTAS